MTHNRKYRKGEAINSLDELACQRFVYFHDKITSAGWFLSWQIRWTKWQIDSGKLFKAVPVGKDDNDVHKKSDAED